jgi:hypothetical protein
MTGPVRTVESPHVGRGRIAGELAAAGPGQLAEPQRAGTAAAGEGAQDAGRKLVTRGRQMLAYTAGHRLAGPYSSMV